MLENNFDLLHNFTTAPSLSLEELQGSQPIGLMSTAVLTEVEVPQEARATTQQLGGLTGSGRLVVESVNWEKPPGKLTELQ